MFLKCCIVLAYEYNYKHLHCTCLCDLKMFYYIKFLHLICIVPDKDPFWVHTRLDSSPNPVVVFCIPQPVPQAGPQYLHFDGGGYAYGPPARERDLNQV